MDKTIRTKYINKEMLKKYPEFVVKCIQEHRVESIDNITSTRYMLTYMFDTS